MAWPDSTPAKATTIFANYKKLEALKIPAKTLGQRIRKRRLEMGLKQLELAAHLGVNPRTIANWEKDRNKPRSRESATLVKRFLEGEIRFEKNLISQTTKRLAARSDNQS